MPRNVFGARKGLRSALDGNWPQLPEPPQRSLVEKLAASIPPSPDEEATGDAPERELLARIAGFREAVADALYDISADYQMLCSLTHAKLEDCEEIVGEVRRRLAGNLHYAVLAKLDEAYALAAAHVGKEA